MAGGAQFLLVLAVIGAPAAALYVLLKASMSRQKQASKIRATKQQKLDTIARRSDQQWQARLNGDNATYAYGEFQPAIHTDSCDCDTCNPAPHSWG